MHAKTTLKQCFYLICIVAAGCSSKRRSLPIPTLKHQKKYSNLSSITIASTGPHAVICIGLNNTIHMGTTAVALQPNKGTKPLDNSTPAGQPTLTPEGTTLTITSTAPYGMVLVGDANTIYRHMPTQQQQTTTANNNSKNEQQPATAHKSKSRKPQPATTGHNQPKTTEKAATSNQKPATKNSSLGPTDQAAAHSNGPDPKQATKHTQATRTADHTASKNAKQTTTNRLENCYTRNLGKAKQDVPTSNGAKPRTRKDVEGLNNTFQEINRKIEKNLQKARSKKSDLQKVQNKLQPTLGQGKGKTKRVELYDDTEKTINDLTKMEQELEDIRTHLTKWIQKDTQNKDMEYLQEIEQKIGSKSMDPNNINVKQLNKTIKIESKSMNVKKFIKALTTQVNKHKK